MRHVYLTAGTLLLAAACTKVETPEQQSTRIAAESQAAKQAIDAKNANWPRLTAAGHADSLVQYYAADAALLPPNMSPMRGHDAIRTFFAVLNTMSTPAPVLTLRAEEVAANGPVAVEVGRWNIAYPAGAKRPPVGPASDSGKYIVHWVKTNGDWVMLHDIWNSDVAIPQPAGRR